MTDFTSRFGRLRPYIPIKVSRRSLNRFLTALVDTGADRTQIPLEALRNLQAKSHGKTPTTYADGRTVYEPLYLVDVEVEGERFTDLEITGSPSAVPLVGRGILARFVLTMDVSANTFALTRKGASPSAP